MNSNPSHSPAFFEFDEQSILANLGGFKFGPWLHNQFPCGVSEWTASLAGIRFAVFRDTRPECEKKLRAFASNGFGQIEEWRSPNADGFWWTEILLQHEPDWMEIEEVGYRDVWRLSFWQDHGREEAVSLRDFFQRNWDKHYQDGQGPNYLEAVAKMPWHERMRLLELGLFVPDVNRLEPRG
jgi:hypothetical protein